MFNTRVTFSSRYYLFQGVDIIVFPEAGLTSVHLPNDRESVKEYLIEIPSPESSTSPCSDPSCDKVRKTFFLKLRNTHNVTSVLEGSF